MQKSPYSSLLATFFVQPMYVHFLFWLLSLCLSIVGGKILYCPLAASEGDELTHCTHDDLPFSLSPYWLL
jgi:hypothetical protein